MTSVKRGVRGGVEDRWHRPPRRGESVGFPADDVDGPIWCMDSKHAKTPGTLVCTAKHGSGKRWMARWVDGDQQERSKSFDRRADAQRHLDGITASLHTGTYADPQRSGVSFRVIAEAWLATKAKRAPKTIAGYRSLLDTQILPKWENEPLREITHERLQNWIAWLSADPTARQRKTTASSAAGLSPARVIQAHQVVRQILSYAVRARYLAVNPAADIELPSRPQSKGVALTHDQVRLLADAIVNAESAVRHRSDTVPARTPPDVLAVMVRLLASSGLRYGECAALRVSDVDIKKRRITVSRSITGVRRQGRVEGETKTHQRRSVPILTTALTQDLARAIADREASEFLFPGPDGGSMSVGWFRVRFNRAVASLGLEGVTPHTLRHTAGSLALASNASVVTVQKLLGHLNATTTMNVYSHQLPDDFDNLAAAMETATGLAAE